MDVLRLYCKDNGIRMYDASRITSATVFLSMVTRCRDDPKAVIVVDYSVAHTAVRAVYYNEAMFSCEDPLLLVWCEQITAIQREDVTHLFLSRLILDDVVENECSICLNDSKDLLMCGVCCIPYCDGCFARQRGVCAFCTNPKMGVRTRAGARAHCNRIHEEVGANIRRALNLAGQEARLLARETPYAKGVRAKYCALMEEKRRQRP